MTEKLGTTWDLTALYQGLDDPNIRINLNQITNDAALFEKENKGKIYSSFLTPNRLSSLIDEVERILANLDELILYSNLIISTDLANKTALALEEEIDTAEKVIKGHLAFYEIELGHVLATRKSEYLNDSSLESCKHYLEKILRKHPYKLSEAEEKIILEKDLYGINGWARLRAEFLSTKKFVVNIQGEKKEVSWSQGHGLFFDKSNDVRKEAMTEILGGLGKDEIVFAAALRNICGNHVKESKRRKYPSPLTPSLIENDITEEMLTSMISVVNDNIQLFQEFILFKGRILGYDKLKGEGFFAPVETEEGDYSWEGTKQLMIDSYSEFDPEIGDIVREMFENKRIDSEPRAAKVAGAFCDSWYNGKKAFVLQSFNGKLSNILTTAHELGHAVHSHLTIARERFFNVRYPMVIAECASEFGTMLFVNKFLRNTKEDTLKRIILFKTVENLMGAVFEVASRMSFEEKLYESITKGEYLSSSKINDLFWEARQIYFGNAIEWLPEQVYQWTWKPHYYMTDLRFYNYPYVFGELLTLGLFAIYLENKEEFVPKFKNFLASGSSKSPQELAKEMGVDLTTKEFWKNGIEEINRLFSELKKFY